MSLDYINPLSNLYNEFLIMLDNMVIKYNCKADVYETTEMTRNADGYLDAIQKKDTFLTYNDYTDEDFDAVGLYDYDIRKKALTDVRAIPVDNYNEITGKGTQYRQKLLERRRQQVIDEYVEPNNYYRMLNGQPDVGTDSRFFFYVSEDIGKEYNISTEIPIHEIQDYYNNLDPEFPDRGDQIMSILEGIGYIDVIRNASRENKYMIYGGTLSGISATLTSAARKELKTTAVKINLTNDLNPITGYKANKNIYYSVSTVATFAGLDTSVGDWIIGTDTGWKKVDTSVKVTGESSSVAYPYLNYLGSKRISILSSRKAKNFSILYLDRNLIRSNVYDTFIDIYNQCRDYMTTVVYQYDFKAFMAYYDNFIAMCIMLMAELHLINKQIPYEVKRNFFDTYALRMLYEAYNIPYDVYADIDTQNLIAQNLNMLIVNKATNKVIYNIANLLGFNNLTAYKYYLARKHKFDPYGNPIFATTQQFNSDTGEIETVPDYKAMYDIYFQKEELMENDFIESFRTQVNRVEYDNITPNDPFWWEDQNLIDRKYQTDYNFVETKYLSLGLSYNMTEVLFENIILLKTIIANEKKLEGISLDLPKITAGASVPLFDTIILLICLVCKKHNLYGDIISLPTSIISVLDYLNSRDRELGLVDTFSFDFDYFIDAIESDDTIENVKRALGKIVHALKDEDGNFYVFDNSPYYTYYSGYELDSNNKPVVLEENIEHRIIEDYIKSGKLEEYDFFDVHGDDVDRFETYIKNIQALNDDNKTRAEKIEALNTVYQNIKELYKFLNEKMLDEDDKERYNALRTFYQAAFYAKEIQDVFGIKWTDSQGVLHERTAKNFYEYLYFKNRMLYSAIFHVDYEEEYDNFLKTRTFPTFILSTVDNSDSLLVIDDSDNVGENQIHISDVINHIPNIKVGERVEVYSNLEYNQFEDNVKAGKIDIPYDTIKGITDGEANNESFTSSTIYYYVNHIISRLKQIVDDVNYSYMLNNTSTLLEELLIKMIKFIKSYTVDFIGLDIVFICDFKPENLLRLIDKVHYIDKTIVPRETLNFSFWDSIKTYINYDLDDRFGFRDIIPKPWFTDPDNTGEMPSRRGIFAWYDATSSALNLGNLYNITNTINTSNADSSVMPYSAMFNTTLLEVSSPKLEVKDDYFDITYDEDYTSSPSSYSGIRVDSGSSINTIIKDRYAYTVYMICKSDDIGDYTGFPEESQGPSVRFLNTPLVDIYSGLGTTTLNIREFVPQGSSISLKNNFVEILTNKDARDWHVIGMTQTKNTVRIYIDGERCLDHTFSNHGDYTDGDSADFQVYTMPNRNLGKGFRDIKNSYSHYMCGIQMKAYLVANINHNSAELQENTKWLYNKYITEAE